MAAAMQTAIMTLGPVGTSLKSPKSSAATRRGPIGQLRISPPRRLRLPPCRASASEGDSSSSSAAVAVAAAVSGDAGVPAVKPNPFAEKRVYKDSFTDLIFIQLCREAYGNLIGFKSAKSFEDGYMGMVEVTHQLMKGRTAQQQLDLVLSCFPEVPAWFRKVFPYSKWGAELNAAITPLFFTWLVGPATTVEVEIDGQKQKSGVKIEKCRYLESSGCVGMCLNLCKGPTQYFFTEEFGMPLTMKPNFEDLSCEMIFGQRPPPREEDEAFQQPCFSSCPTAKAIAPNCPKLS